MDLGAVVPSIPLTCPPGVPQPRQEVPPVPLAPRVPGHPVLPGGDVEHRHVLLLGAALPLPGAQHRVLVGRRRPAWHRIRQEMARNVPNGSNSFKIVQNGSKWFNFGLKWPSRSSRAFVACRSFGIGSSNNTGSFHWFCMFFLHSKHLTLKTDLQPTSVDLL